MMMDGGGALAAAQVCSTRLLRRGRGGGVV